MVCNWKSEKTYENKIGLTINLVSARGSDLALVRDVVVGATVGHTLQSFFFGGKRGDSLEKLSDLSFIVVNLFAGPIPFTMNVPRYLVHVNLARSEHNHPSSPFFPYLQFVNLACVLTSSLFLIQLDKKYSLPRTWSELFRRIAHRTAMSKLSEIKK